LGRRPGEGWGGGNRGAQARPKAAPLMGVNQARNGGWRPEWPVWRLKKGGRRGLTRLLRMRSPKREGAGPTFGVAGFGLIPTGAGRAPPARKKTRPGRRATAAGPRVSRAECSGTRGKSHERRKETGTAWGTARVWRPPPVKQRSFPGAFRDSRLTSAPRKAQGWQSKHVSQLRVLHGAVRTVVLQRLSIFALRHGSKLAVWGGTGDLSSSLDG